MALRAARRRPCRSGQRQRWGSPRFAVALRCCLPSTVHPQDRLCRSRSACPQPPLEARTQLLDRFLARARQRPPRPSASAGPLTTLARAQVDHVQHVEAHAPQHAEPARERWQDHRRRQPHRRRHGHQGRVPDDQQGPAPASHWTHSLVFVYGGGEERRSAAKERYALLGAPLDRGHSTACAFVRGERKKPHPP